VKQEEGIRVLSIDRESIGRKMEKYLSIEKKGVKLSINM